MKKGIITVISAAVGIVAGIMGTGYMLNKEIRLQEKKVNKFKSYYNLLNQWLVLQHKNKNLSEYFIKNDYKTIAVYGMGILGNRLIDELQESDVVVKYAIDENADSTYSEVKVYDLDDKLDKVGAVVVTAVFAFDEVRESLSKVMDCPIISLGDVICEVCV